jgi:hypothetical protein
MIGKTGTMRSGIVACNSSGTELALVMSTTMSCDIPAMERTVSLTSRSVGLGKSKITTTLPRVRSAAASRSRTRFRRGRKRPRIRTRALAISVLDADL